jgi:hypothetical protein
MSAPQFNPFSALQGEDAEGAGAEEALASSLEPAEPAAAPAAAPPAKPKPKRAARTAAASTPAEAEEAAPLQTTPAYDEQGWEARKVAERGPGRERARDAGAAPGHQLYDRHADRSGRGREYEKKGGVGVGNWGGAEEEAAFELEAAEGAEAGGGEAAADAEALRLA